MRSLLLVVPLLTVAGFAHAQFVPGPLEPGIGFVTAATFESLFNENGGDSFSQAVDIPTGEGDTSVGLSIDESLVQSEEVENRLIDPTFVDSSAVGSTILTVLEFGTPVVEAKALASVARRPTTGTDENDNLSASASGASALAYQFRAAKDGLQIPGLEFPAVPLRFRIFVNLRAEVTGTEANPASVTNAIATVIASEQPITFAADGTLIFDVPTSQVLYSELIIASSTGEPFAEVDPPFGVPVQGLVEPDRDYWLGKSAQAGATASLNEVLSSVSSARAILDPVIEFDQAVFDALYGNACVAAGLPACPPMEDLFTIEVSPGVSNEPVIVPLSPSIAPALAPLLVGIGAHALWRERSRARA